MMHFLKNLIKAVDFAPEKRKTSTRSTSLSLSFTHTHTHTHTHTTDALLFTHKILHISGDSWPQDRKPCPMD